MRSKRICFVASNIYPVLRGDSEGFMGGAEFQQVIIGEHLRDRGIDVCYVTMAFAGNREQEIVNGMQVFKTFAETDGLPFLRFFFAKIPRIWRALKEANADIYYQRGAEAMTGVIALFCRIHGKSFIFSAAHDTNFIPSRINVPYWRDKFLYRWGLKHASHIIAQSHQQKILLRKNFGLEASVVYNVYPTRNLVEDGRYVLWVANIKPMKRPLLFIDIVRSCPDIQFKMIGGMVRDHEALYAKVEAEAATLDNLNFLGFQPLDATERCFDNASLFVNTSELEGFPNTFLQSWARGIPTVSFFDADDIIRKNRLGAILREGDDVASILYRLADSPKEYRLQIQAYFTRTHLPEGYLDHLAEVIEPGSAATEMKAEFDAT